MSSTWVVAGRGSFLPPFPICKIHPSRQSNHHNCIFRRTSMHQIENNDGDIFRNVILFFDIRPLHRIVESSPFTSFRLRLGWSQAGGHLWTSFGVLSMCDAIGSTTPELCACRGRVTSRARESPGDDLAETHPGSLRIVIGGGGRTRTCVGESGAPSLAARSHPHISPPPPLARNARKLTS